MNRRSFLKQSGTAILGLNSFPYILPSGTLFAPTGRRLANHVVFCLFAGGIRNFESVEKAEGNLMPRMLKGNEKISSTIFSDIDEMPPIGTGFESLQQRGTFYKNFRYKSHATIHYTGHAAAITGVYAPNVPLMKPLNYPSVFEYYRKFSSPSKSALNTWWVSDQAGPFTFLNYSDYPGYGSRFGANMLQPTSFFNSDLQSLYNFNSAKDYEIISKLQVFFNEHAQIATDQLTKKEIENTIEDRNRIGSFLSKMNNEYMSLQFNPWELGVKANEDIMSMYAATRILKEFQPELLVVNMQHSDIGHQNFTQYCNNIHKADYAVWQLWKTIQDTPELKDDTVLIIAPEFGRNLQSNGLIDNNGKYAIDHTGDDNSQKIFCMLLGPPHIVKQNIEIASQTGETIDILPTIAQILGFHDELPKNIIDGRFLNEAFI